MAATTTRKRSATKSEHIHTSSPNKKPKLDKRANPKKGQGRGVDDEEPTSQKKRAKPVTRAELELGTEETSGDESGHEVSGIESDLEGDETMGDLAEMGEAETKPQKDPQANRESHAAQRALLVSRRASKPHGALIARAKQVWGDARKDGISKAELKDRVAELMDIIRGSVGEVVLKHDASRIVQTVVKYGTPEARLEIAKELDGHFVNLAQGKYSKFLVSKLIRYSPTARSIILPSLAPHTPRLIHHAFASSVLADAYELHCTAAERSQLMRAFWGKEAQLFEDGKRAGGLRAVLEASTDDERRKRTIGAVKENLLGVFNTPSPIAARHAITHRALWEYLECVGSTQLFPVEKLPDAERERSWREVYESCQELLAEMVHTKDGSRVVREFLARGTAKDRKQILKVLKPHLLNIATDDDAQLVLFTALDVTDDTKLTGKLLSELLPSSSLLDSTAGRRTLLYPLTPRSTRHYTPAIVNALAKSQELSKATSKKDEEARRTELKKAASPALLALVESKGAASCRDAKASLVITEIMLSADGDKSKASEQLLLPLQEPYPAPDTDNWHVIDLPHSSRLYKTLLQGGHFSHATKTVERSPAFDAAAFARAFIRATGQDKMLAIARDGGAFVVAELCERVREEGDEEVKAELKRWFDGSVNEIGNDSSVKGSAVLAEKLRLLGIK